MFTSPPYYNTEIYSEDKQDSSNFKSYEEFLDWYEIVFQQAVARLKTNRFLVVKIGEGRRDNKGFFYNLVGDSISCFLKLDLKLYNTAVLLTKKWTAAQRVRRQFPNYRKLASTHQTLLCFFKVDTDKAIPQEIGILSEKEYGEVE